MLNCIQKENFMGTRIKPVQATVIKDKAIIEQVIKEIRRQRTPEQIAEQKRVNKIIMGMVRERK
jgi:galactose-1-phosphate uridylyltransferase